MKTTLVLALFLVTSCASKKPTYAFDNIEFDSFVYADVENRTVYVTYKYLDLDQRFNEYQKSGQINRDIDTSCLNTPLSVNFINVMLEDIPQFRPFVTKMKYDVTYKSSNVMDAKGNLNSLHIEKRIERMIVEQKTCYKKINGELNRVTSEVYTYD